MLFSIFNLITPVALENLFINSSKKLADCLESKNVNYIFAAQINS
jgi:hypothetical protein